MKEKVVVAMSGGVDSSVAALLLKQQGYDVVGMMLRLWSEGGPMENKCCTPRALDNAQVIADDIGIPFYVRDYKDRFKQSIVSYFIDTYAVGETPNPCVICNQKIRFGMLQGEALKLGARYFATGHYAKVNRNEHDLLELRKGNDPEKDQSYVLYRLNQKQLKHCLFPLGELTKPKVREIAEENKLIVSKLPDSQDLCFLGNGDYKEFLHKHAPNLLKPGEIKDIDGRVLGQHNGVQGYTIGQRKGLGIAAPTPLYVIALDVEKNEVVVGEKDLAIRSKITLKDVVFTSIPRPKKPIDISVKIRYGSHEISAILEPHEEFDTQAVLKLGIGLSNISPGQSAVFYQEDRVLGGGIIAETAN